MLIPEDRTQFASFAELRWRRAQKCNQLRKMDPVVKYAIWISTIKEGVGANNIPSL